VCIYVNSLSFFGIFCVEGCLATDLPQRHHPDTYAVNLTVASVPGDASVYFVTLQPVPSYTAW